MSVSIAFLSWKPFAIWVKNLHKAMHKHTFYPFTYLQRFLLKNIYNLKFEFLFTHFINCWMIQFYLPHISYSYKFLWTAYLNMLKLISQDVIKIFFMADLVSEDEHHPSGIFLSGIFFVIRYLLIIR